MSDSTTLRELNEHVWLAYRAAYRAGDAAAFLALHDPGVIRAGGPAKRVSGFAELALDTTRWFADLAERGGSVAIDFRFTERIAGGGVASERGVYRLVATRAGGDRRTFHGRFHVFTRRVEGRWRIVVDYDSDEQGTVTAPDYESATPLDDVSSWQVSDVDAAR
ncbi:YybH family protein [Umezawaea sp.]|uniref:YybH family protein n=1 Tax=Umezawaea sp. TaxID=1955258 RepID=UPI002ED4F194